MFEPDGSISGIHAHGVDLSERHRSEAALAELAEQRRLALDAAQMGWWHLDVASGKVRCDARFRENLWRGGRRVSLRHRHLFDPPRGP